MRATYRRGAASRGAVDQCIGARGKRSPNPLGRQMGGKPRAPFVPKPPQARSKCGAVLTVLGHFVFCTADYLQSFAKEFPSFGGVAGEA
jgi:hypothetical protein